VLERQAAATSVTRRISLEQFKFQHGRYCL
jgi:hypothetical protein